MKELFDDELEKCLKLKYSIGDNEFIFYNKKELQENLKRICDPDTRMA